MFAESLKFGGNTVYMPDSNYTDGNAFKNIWMYVYFKYKDPLQNFYYLPNTYSISIVITTRDNNLKHVIASSHLC